MPTPRSPRPHGIAVEGTVTIVGYVAGHRRRVSFAQVAVAIYVAVALMWLIPDKRFEALID